MTYNVLKALERNDQLQQEKQPWNVHWQLVHEYILQRKATFTTQETPGAFIHSDVWSSVASKAAETASSALIGLMWPDANSFKLEPFGEYEDNEELQDFFEDATETLQAAMDDPAAGLALAMDEFFLDAMVSGSPAIHTEEGDVSDLRFDARNVQQFAIDEGADGYVDTIYTVMEYGLRGAAEKFGLENLSKKTQESFKSGKFGDKIKVLHVIEPRAKDDQNPMRYASVYIEIEAKHLIKEGGYHELPTFVFRYSKRIGEKYGRSPGMRALPDIMELNQIWEIVTIGLEKNFDPPLAVWDDGTFGGGTIDTSASAINVINVSGKLPSGRAPIEPLFTVGNFQEIAVLIERLEDTVKDHFMVDRLLDFNNETQMTARETLLRNSMRQSLLRSVVNRIITEALTPMITRCFNILLRKGRFGFVPGTPEAIAWQAVNPGKEMKTLPDALVKAAGERERMYKIRYMTPAAREQKAEEANGIMNIYQFMASMIPVDPTLKDMLNGKRSMKALGEAWSVPHDIFNSEDEMAAIQEAAMEQAQKTEEIQTGMAQAGIVKDMAGAQAAMAKAQQG